MVSIFSMKNKEVDPFVHNARLCFKVWLITIVIFIPFLYLLSNNTFDLSRQNNFLDKVGSTLFLGDIFVGCVSFVLAFGFGILYYLKKMFKKSSPHQHTEHTESTPRITVAPANNLLVVLLVICLIFIAYLIGKDQAKFLSSKSENNLVPTVTVSTPIPTAEQVRTQYIPVATVDPDPPVLCNVNPNCGGGTKPLKQSECNNSTCCGFPDGSWVFYKDKNQCIADQKAKQPISETPMVPVFLTGYNYTRYCKPAGVDAVKSADVSYYKALQDYKSCLSDKARDSSTCSNGCRVYSDNTKYTNCLNECSSINILGNDSCKITLDISGNALTRLLDQYCR